MIHLYAFTASGIRIEGIRGIDGALIDEVALEDVAAVVSHAAEAEPTTEALLAHGRVIEELRDRSDAVLPVRFGERLTRTQLKQALAEQLPDWRARLARVRGCVEFGVRMFASHPVVDGVTGADYMRHQLAAWEQTNALLTDLACRSRESVLGRGDSAAYLVEAEERPAFERAVADFTADHPDLTLVCTGPWAPWSFTEAT